MPKVSIILTSYNHEKYIREAIDSVLSQSFTDFELLIWDDASEDNSWQIINNYSDPRIRAIRNDVRRRAIWGINKAISELTSGSYIAIHHSDDIWKPDKLEKQVAFLDSHPDIGAVFTNALAIGEDSTALNKPDHFYSNIFDQPNRTRFEWLNYFFNRGNALCHPSVLIRKSCYEDCGLYRFGFAQVGDLDMWIRLCLQHEIHVIPEKLVRFRVLDNEANVSGSRPETRIRGLYEMHKLFPTYRKITHFDDLVKIFPSAAKFFRKQETDMDFALAMVALEEKPFPFTILFGLNILFEIISDPKRADSIKRLYDFDYKSFIALTAQYDVFSREEVATLSGQLVGLNQAVAERDGQITNLNQALAEAEGLRSVLAEKDGVIVNLTEAGAQKQAHISHLESVVREKEAEAEVLKTGLAERERDLGSLKKTISQRDSEISELTDALSERDKVKEELNEKLSQKDAHIFHLVRVVGEKETEPEKLKADLAEKEAALNNIYSSHGWKGLLTYYKVRNSLLPVGTRRRQFAVSIFKLLLRASQITSKVLFRSKSNPPVTPAEGHVREEACEKPAVNSMLPAAIPLFPQSLPCLEKRSIPHKRILQVSIVIPTKNAGPLFRDTLEGLKAQNYDGDIEIIVVDSGSTDDTMAMALQYGATIISTRPAEFDHGLTRNQAIEAASGEIIVLMSQDVLPGDQYLIRNFVKAFEDPLVAGAYARQLPRQDADIITKRNLNNWLTGRIEKEVRWIKDWTIYRNWSPFERYYFCNFDNVCSAIRKSVWEDIPFMPNQFGEDIDWAQKILEAGWKISYWPSSFVIHSHSRTFMYEYRRNYLCHKKLLQQFGIHTVPSWKNIFLSTIKSTILDWKYTIHNEKQVVTMLKLLMETPFINIAGVYGQYKGAKAGGKNTNATSNLIGRKKRIILTVHQFFPDYSSGTEILTYETAKELQKAGHDVVVFTGYPARDALKDDVRFDRYIFDGIPVERFKHSYVPMGDQSNIQELEYNNRLFRKYFTEYLKKNKTDIVHFFHLSRLSASAIDACIELGIPMVLTPTDFWFICPTAQLRLPDQKSCPGPNKLSVNCVRHVVANTQPKEINRLVSKIPDWLLAIIIIAIKNGVKFDNKFSPLAHALVNRRVFLRERMRHIHKVAIPTQVMMSMLNHNGLDESRTTNIPFGLNLAYLQNTKRPEPNNVLHLGYIGTLSEHKGVHILAKAITQLAGMPIELKVYGKVDDFPDYVEGLKNILQGDPRVKFCGTFPNPQIGSIFSEMDALVVPSLWYENSPLVIYSAQAAGCPVIGSNMDGISEVIEHGINGLLFKAGNVSGLAMAIESLINDKELLKKLSKNARKPLSIEEYAVKLLDIYNELIQENKAF